MSKERELLQALKESVEKDPYSTSEAAKEAAQQAPVAQDAAAATSSGLDVHGMLDFFNAMGASMIDDPLFYVKLAGVIILAIIILFLAFELIVGS